MSDNNPTIRIDSVRAIQLLREVVAEFGEDYVYGKAPLNSDEGTAACTYVRGGESSCLVGKALHRAGATISQLLEMDGKSDPSISLVQADWLDITEEARVTFSVAQDAQDEGESWGYALLLAEFS